MFKQKKIKYQASSEDLSRIKNLEESILKLCDLNTEVPEILTQELSDLKAKISPNKINAKKLVYNGLEFDSTREAKLAKALDEAKIPYECQVQIELQDGFKLESETVRPIHIEVDFMVNQEWLLDVKGYIQQPFPIKWKMLKYKFKDTKRYFIVAKDSDINTFITLVKNVGWKDTLNL